METLPDDPRPKRIPKRIKQAIEDLVRGDAKSITDAAERAGYTREHLSREIHKRHIQQYLRDRRGRSLTIASARATARVSDLLDASSEHVSLDAAKFILGIDGVKPASDGMSLNVNVNLRAGYVLDLRSPDEIVDVTPPRKD